MMNNKYLFLTLCLCSVYHISLSSFNPKKLLDNFWPKIEREQIQKDLPLSDGSTVELHMHQGTLTVKPWNQNKIIIEAEKIGTAQELKDTSIAIKAPVAQAKPSHLTITTRGIPEQKAATVNYTLMVPEHTALLVRSSSQGIVKIKQLDGSLDISLAEGDIDIANATTSVSAKTGKGTIKLKQKKLGERESIFLENGQGDVYIYLPRETQATVHARTLNGTVTSAHAITLQPQTVRLNKETWERIKKEVDGTLGTGGAPITLEATKGNISIEEY